MNVCDLEVGDFVVVDTEGGKPGQVRYFERDTFDRNGIWVGVALVNEKGRIDEWQPSQVRQVTPEEASRLATRFVNLKR
jgi:hypothetical protein